MEWDLCYLIVPITARGNAPVIAIRAFEMDSTMPIEQGTDEERILLGRWIKKGQGLIVGGSALGDAYLDPNIKRPDDVQQDSEEYVAFDHQVAEQLPHHKGRFRYELEKYYRDRYGPYLPRE